TTNILRRRSMKLVKNLVFAVLLACIISINATAGEVETPNVYTPPPPPTPEQVLAYEEGTSPSYYPYSGEITAETTDYLLFEMLAALLSVY
ncbi:MAG TPA: hypothetical protein VFZ22_13960, partial [Pyrinomonadaceae bacterium]|nr:hypothetical protein [Pyrinomonadaceae bacterium]